MKVNYTSPALYFSISYLVFILFGYTLNNQHLPLWEPLFFTATTASAAVVILYLVSFIFSYMFLCYIGKVLSVRTAAHDFQANSVFNVGVLFFLISFVFFAIFYFSIGLVPVLSSDIENIRATSKIGSGKYLILANSFSLVSAAMTTAYLNKLSSSRKLIFWVLYVTVIILLAGTGYRAPAAYLILISLVSYYVFSRGKVTRSLYIYTGILFLITVFFGVLRNGGDIRSLMIPIAWAASVNFYNINVITDIYPLRLEYLYGFTFINDILAAIPGAGYDFFGNQLKIILAKDFSGEGITITAPGEGYINLGIFGSVIHALITATLAFIARSFFSKKRGVLYGVTGLILAINFGRIVTAGIMPALAFFLVPNAIVCFVFIALCRKIKY